MASSPPLGNVIVIGGCGFLGHHIVRQLLDEPNTSVSVLDLHTDRNRFPNVQYFPGDLTSRSSVRDVFSAVKPSVVIHTASPIAYQGASHTIFDRVNVEGTKNLLTQAAKVESVKAFVYTSSSSVMHAGPYVDVVGIDETSPIVIGKDQPEYYSHTKGLAEIAVLGANRSETTRPDFLTCVLRPAGIFGEGDTQLTEGLLTTYHNGKVRFQIGNNKNLFDFTYVGNIAQAHILAAKALLRTSTMKTAPLDYEKVDGEAFLITNGDPRLWWDFARAVWREAGDRTPMEEVRVMPKTFMLIVATIAEWIYWILFLGKRTPTLHRSGVRYTTMTRYFNIEKAQRRLGYKPQVTIEEGIKRAVTWRENQRKLENARGGAENEKSQ